MPADLAIHDWPLPYEARLETRRRDAIDLVVIHCTELPDMATAREFGERVRYADTGTGNSGHYYIDVDGTVHRFVADDRVAHHCYQYNPRSIGIELSNLGRYPHWNDSRHQTLTTPYPPVQVDALLALLGRLRNAIPALRYIAAHADLDRRLEPASDDPAILVPRRLDPGPLFPWDRVLQESGLVRLPPP